jgi:hypothetical protein
MRLSSLVSKDFVLNPTANDYVLKCRNREHALMTGFWSTYDRLAEGQKVVLVTDKEDDLIHLNYLLSRYGLKELSLIINDCEQINLNYFHSKKIEEETLKPRLSGALTDSAQLTKSVTQYITEANKALSHLQAPVLGNYSVSNINDQLESGPYKHVDIEEQLLKPPYSFEDYKKKKDFFEEIETRYDLTFEYAKQQDPFNGTLEELGDISSVVSVLQDFLENAASVKQRYQLLEKRIAEELSADYPDEGALNAALEMHLMRMTPAIKGGDTTKAFLVEVNQLTQELQDLNVFKEVPERKSTSIFHQKQNLLNLISFVEYGLFFLEDNKQYIRWRAYSAQMTPQDYQLIKYLTSQNQFWGTAFKNLYLQYYLAYTKPALRSANRAIDRLDVQAKQLLEKFAAPLQKKHFAHSMKWPTAPTKWCSFLAESGHDAVQRFPLLIMTKAGYEKNVEKMAYIDTFVFVNSCPKVLHTENWLSNLVIGYDSAFVINSETLQSRQPEVEFAASGDIYCQLNRSFENLKISEVNRASKYLGQELYKYNKNFKIFQLKSVSIISFLTDVKNARLIENLASEGVKGLHSNASGVNLVPALLTDTQTQTLILIEDGIFSAAPEHNLVPQRQLVEDLKTAGIKLVSIDNYEMITDGFEILNRLTTKIKKLNQVEREAVLIS